jgi:hypothetical protein
MDIYERCGRVLAVWDGNEDAYDRGDDDKMRWRYRAMAEGVLNTANQGAVEACERWREWEQRAANTDEPELWRAFAVAMDELCTRLGGQ